MCDLECEFGECLRVRHLSTHTLTRIHARLGDMQWQPHRETERRTQYSSTASQPVSTRDMQINRTNKRETFIIYIARTSEHVIPNTQTHNTKTNIHMRHPAHSCGTVRGTFAEMVFVDGPRTKQYANSQNIQIHTLCIRFLRVGHKVAHKDKWTN